MQACGRRYQAQSDGCGPGSVFGLDAQKRLVDHARPLATSMRRSTQPSRLPDKTGASIQDMASTDVYIACQHIFPRSTPLDQETTESATKSIRIIAAHAPEFTLAW